MFRRPLNRHGYASPWREIERLQRDMNRLFSDTVSGVGRRNAPSYPAINIWTGEKGAVVTAELPGLSPEDIDISVAGETLTLTGNREPDEFQEGTRYHRRERNHGRFTRTFQLPFSVEMSKVEATFEKGILHIDLPRAEQEMPKKIAIKAA